ncbi:hypothetical protein NHX12_028236 [Muraenolepis orangiensis]|uniref:Ribosomal protein eL8/eL30/eS12/Gadd45 domain-containing protein n=1 Tax=Muraenolepis orangiensis TaxID=630683 RepID=A0A9Q0INK9_9TELE|nr:hypothetical protein NHX12_028236 [Muraenolepis orangiensis]
MSSETRSEEEEGRFSSRVINIVFFILLLDLLGFTLILPLFPSILDHYGQTEDAVYQSLQSVVDWFRGTVGIPMDRKYNSVLFGGLIGSLFSLLQFLASPLTGAASDRHGRRPLLLLTTLGLICSYAIWAVSRSFSMFLVFRVIGGVCKGNVSLCAAIVADLPCPKARNRGMAMIGIAFSLGFTVGPLMGAYFAVNSSGGEHFHQYPALLALFFSLADLLFIWLLLPETLPKDCKVSSSGLKDPTDLLNPCSLFYFSAVSRVTDPPSRQRMRKLQVLGLVYFTFLFLFSGLEFTLSFLTHQRFHFTRVSRSERYGDGDLEEFGSSGQSSRTHRDIIREDGALGEIENPLPIHHPSQSLRFQSKKLKPISGSQSKDRMFGERPQDGSRRDLKGTQSAPSSAQSPKGPPPYATQVTFQVKMADFPELAVGAPGTSAPPAQTRAPSWAPNTQGHGAQTQGSVTSSKPPRKPVPKEDPVTSTREPPKFEDEDEFPDLGRASSGTSRLTTSSNTAKLCNEECQTVRPQSGEQHRVGSGKGQPSDATKKGQKSEKATGKKSKVPLQLDIGTMLEVLEKKHQSQKSKPDAKPVILSVGGALPVGLKQPVVQKKGAWQQEKIAHNPLDATSPMVKKGKQREVILKEREERKHNRLLQERGIDTRQESKPGEEPSVGEQEDTIDTGHRKFRDYCSQVLSKDVDECVSALLKELVRFQDRLYQKDPMKARMKKRLVMGLREVLKHLKLRKVKCVVISPNCERIQSKGGLDEALHTIIDTCREQGVPFVFALSRKALGRCVSKAVPVSLVGIFNYDGAQDFYHKMIELSSEARKTYEEMLERMEPTPPLPAEEKVEPEPIEPQMGILEKGCNHQLLTLEEQLSSLLLDSEEHTDQRDGEQQS